MIATTSVMQKPFPHHYVVTAVVGPVPEVVLETAGVSPLRTDLPQEFGGPGNRWSPETLFVAAIADCYAMTFRGIAAKSRLAWTSLRLEVAGTLDRVSEVTRFTNVLVAARLFVPQGTSETIATRVLEKAESSCLITRSLNSTVTLNIAVEWPQRQVPAA